MDNDEHQYAETFLPLKGGSMEPVRGAVLDLLMVCIVHGHWLLIFFLTYHSVIFVSRKVPEATRIVCDSIRTIKKEVGQTINDFRSSSEKDGMIPKTGRKKSGNNQIEKRRD